VGYEFAITWDTERDLPSLLIILNLNLRCHWFPAQNAQHESDGAQKAQRQISGITVSHPPRSFYENTTLSFFVVSGIAVDCDRMWWLIGGTRRKKANSPAFCKTCFAKCYLRNIDFENINV
jgi:hypothetical protein